MLTSVNVLQCVQNILNFFLPSFKMYVLFLRSQYSTVLFKDLSAGSVPTLSNLTVQVQYKVVPYTYIILPDGTGTVQFSHFMLCTYIGMNRLKISESHDTHWLGLIFKEAYQKCWLSMCVRHTVKSHNIAIPAEKITAYVYIVVGYCTLNDIHSVNVTLNGCTLEDFSIQIKSQFLSCTVLSCT
jgi:hypothetical protein